MEESCCGVSDCRFLFLCPDRPPTRRDRVLCRVVSRTKTFFHSIERLSPQVLPSFFFCGHMGEIFASYFTVPRSKRRALGVEFYELSNGNGTRYHAGFGVVSMGHYSPISTCSIFSAKAWPSPTRMGSPDEAFLFPRNPCFTVGNGIYSSIRTNVLRTEMGPWRLFIGA